MFLQLDHLIASVVGGIVLLMMLTVHFSSQQSNVDSIRYYMNHTQTLAFIDALKSDFPNVGAGVTEGDPMILDLQHGDSLTTTFEFLATVDTTAGATVERLRYQVVFSDSVVTDDNTGTKEAVYRIERLRYNGVSYDMTGASAAFIIDFDITLYDASNKKITTTDYTQAHTLVVDLTSLSPLGDDGIIGKMKWQRRFRLPNISG